MNLDEAQKKKVAEWIDGGAKLSEIQNRLASELNVRLTYMEVRLLVDDMKLTPKDPEIPKAPVLPPPQAPASTLAPSPAPAPASPASPGASSVVVSVDQLTRPGALVSGKVTFSDGNRADWYLDQGGRLGLAPQQAGYRPPPADLQQFQMSLEAELSRLGF
jgi:hypothetical protein